MRPARETSLSIGESMACKQCDVPWGKVCELYPTDLSLTSNDTIEKSVVHLD